MADVSPSTVQPPTDALTEATPPPVAPAPVVEAAPPAETPPPPATPSWEQVAEQYPEAAAHVKRLQGDMTRAHEAALAKARATSTPAPSTAPTLPTLNDTMRRLAGLEDGDPFEKIEVVPKPDFKTLLKEHPDALTNEETLAAVLERLYDEADKRATSRITGLSRATYEPIREQAVRAQQEARAAEVESKVRSLPGMRDEAEFDKVITFMHEIGLVGEGGFRKAHAILSPYNQAWTAPPAPAASASPAPAPKQPEVVVRPAPKAPDPLAAARALSQGLNPSSEPVRQGGPPPGSEGTAVEARYLANDATVKAALRSGDQSKPSWMRVPEAIRRARGG